jgi:hypothetical protein
MQTLPARHVRVNHSIVPSGLRLISAADARRRFAAMSPLLATAALTAAIFLLPAVSEVRHARASVDEIKVSATHIPYDAASPSATNPQ